MRQEAQPKRKKKKKTAWNICIIHIYEFIESDVCICSDSKKLHGACKNLSYGLSALKVQRRYTCIHAYKDTYVYAKFLSCFLCLATYLLRFNAFVVVLSYVKNSYDEKRKSKVESNKVRLCIKLWG